MSDIQTQKPLWRSYLKLARPAQWSKSVFVLVGPIFGLADMPDPDLWTLVTDTFLAALAFALASSACYVINDIADAEADRAHPRKRNRPIASGAIKPAQARLYALVLYAVSGVCLVFLPDGVRWWVALCVGLYVVNVNVYSAWAKHHVILDVMGLALGFVLRVFGGCAAVGIAPTVWLLNCTFFLSMFLAFGKRLGERRTMGEESVTAVRGVQAQYTEALLRMAVVVTAVATLVAYAGYVQTREEYQWGFNLLWLTILPATYGLLRCIVLLEHGAYDDPTVLATKDRPFQGAMVVFAGVLVVLLVRFKIDWV